MVQAASPTSVHVRPTTISVNGGLCFEIGELAQRISDFVASIFTTIVDFVKACLCDPGSTAPAGTVNAVIRRFAADPAPPRFAYFRTRMAYLAQTYPGFNFREWMQTPEKARLFLARLTLFDLATAPATLQPYAPHLITHRFREEGNNYLVTVIELGIKFRALSPYDRNSVYWDFIIGQSPDVPTWEYNDPAPCRAFVNQANSFVEEFFVANAQFCEHAEALRTDYFM